MGNAPKNKGTHWETALLTPLRAIFGPQVSRSRNSAPSQDFVNTRDVVVEAKWVACPHFLQWVSNMRKHHGTHRWAIIWKGDARTPSGQPLMLVDWRFGQELLSCWERHHASLEPGLGPVRGAHGAEEEVSGPELAESNNC